MALTIREARRGDEDAIVALYNIGIAERQATFETRPRRAAEVTEWLDAGRPFLVAEDGDGQIVGFARVVPYSHREVYAGIGEHGVSVDPSARGAAPPRRSAHRPPPCAR